MFKVKKIVEVKPYSIICELYNGVLKKLEILPLLETQVNCNGIDQLQDKATFENVTNGEIRELF